MSAKTYHHMSAERIADETMLKGKGNPILSVELEQLLETQRPPSCIPRNDCVYMREDRDFRMVGLTYDAGYVHVVEPIGTVEKRDCNWIGEIQRRNLPDVRFWTQEYLNLTDEELAKRYWEGAVSKSPSWEYISTSARVVSSEASPTPVRPTTMRPNSN